MPDRSKYAGQRYVVLASDVDEIPSQATVLGLRDFGYAHAHVPISLEMEFSYFNFNWTAQHLWYHAFAVNDVGLAANITLDEYRCDQWWHQSNATPCPAAFFYFGKRVQQHCKRL